jgi:hypothetical protein
LYQLRNHLDAARRSTNSPAIQIALDRGIAKLDKYDALLKKKDMFMFATGRNSSTDFHLAKPCILVFNPNVKMSHFRNHHSPAICKELEDRLNVAFCQLYGGGISAAGVDTSSSAVEKQIVR